MHNYGTSYSFSFISTVNIVFQSIRVSHIFIRGYTALMTRRGIAIFRDVSFGYHGRYSIQSRNIIIIITFFNPAAHYYQALSYHYFIVNLALLFSPHSLFHSHSISRPLSLSHRLYLSPTLSLITLSFCIHLFVIGLSCVGTGG